MRYIWLLVLLFVGFLIIILGQTTSSSIKQKSTVSTQRIVSLSPNITEMLFALELDDRVVGVTKYCDYPERTLSLPKVGALLDPNLEAIIALAPDLVILNAKQSRTIAQLQQLNIPTLAVKTTYLNDVMTSIERIGKVTHHQVQADKLVLSMKKKITSITDKVAGLERPKVMLTLGHSSNSAHVKTIYIAGQHDFYNDLINLAGGENSYQGLQLSVPSISIEGIIQLNPQIIIDVFPEADNHNSDLTQVMKQWKTLDYVNAIKNDRVHIIEKSYATIPGPRLIQLLDDMARLIHPEIAWQE